MLFSSRVLAAAVTVGASCKIVPQPAQLEKALTADCRLAFVDLGMPGLNLPDVVAAVRSTAPAAKIVAFGPHVDEALLNAAREAGCDVVLPRSQFNKQYVDLLRGAIN